MLRWLYDLLFTRSKWTIIDKRSVVKKDSDEVYATVYVLQDQWGNIKQTQIEPDQLR